MFLQDPWPSPSVPIQSPSGHPLRWHSGDLGPSQLRRQLSQGAGAAAGGVAHLPRQCATVAWRNKSGISWKLRFHVDFIG